MNTFNKTQKWLIEQCERTHEARFHHTGLSGTICENLLTGVLRRDVPELSFDRGIISFGADSSRGIVNNKELSPQLDIIIYRGKPITQIGGHVIVHESKAKGIIEVKKWLYSHSLLPAQKQLKRIKNLTDRFSKTKNVIELFLVTFRFHDRINIKRNWFTETKNFGIKNHYCFSGRFSTIKGVNLYPWQEMWWNDFETYPYAGQYEKLIRDIKKLN